MPQINNYLTKLQASTRWDNIPDIENAYRLLCSNPACSLSCANIRHGKLSLTSMHGTERHSYQFTKQDAAFAALMFLTELTEKELSVFCDMFTKISDSNVLHCKNI